MSNPSRKLVFGFALLAIVLLAVEFIKQWRDQAAVRAFREAIVAGGGKLTIDELAPRPSAEAQQAANALLQAAWRLRDGAFVPGKAPGAMKPVSPGKASVAWREPDIRQQRSTNTWEQLAAELAETEEPRREIRELLTQTEFGLNLDYHQGFELLLPHLARVKAIAQHLVIDTVNDLHDGRLDEASANLEALASLPETLRDEPLRYRLNADGTWILYSVGENGVDDGGHPQPPPGKAPAKIFASGLDAVWPRPATPEEIAQAEETSARGKNTDLRARYGLAPAK
jgi:hypothetical protein